MASTQSGRPEVAVGSKEGRAMEAKELEGWFTDPFGRHEARWLS